jgi:hypothetical protein
MPERFSMETSKHSSVEINDTGVATLQICNAVDEHPELGCYFRADSNLENAADRLARSRANLTGLWRESFHWRC